jgi:molybdopterin-binding protein
VRRFLDNALQPQLVPARSSEPPPLRLSARNQLSATVSDVKHGEVMSTVHVTVAEAQEATAAITRDAAIDLDVAPGDDVLVIVKSTEVMIAKPG